MLLRKQPWEAELILRCKECPENKKFETTKIDEVVRHCQERHSFLGLRVEEEVASGAGSGRSEKPDGSESSSEAETASDSIVERRRSV